ncbi:hypothetical protein K440DRAFT_57544 [Wilcoxina mikolae CBS 423.85]|nr:hypothetical protein K440DRAFT_57544 [Wilcoxina mikolae CBS 423.85]
MHFCAVLDGRIYDELHYIYISFVCSHVGFLLLFSGLLIRSRTGVDGSIIGFDFWFILIWIRWSNIRLFFFLFLLEDFVEQCLYLCRLGYLVKRLLSFYFFFFFCFWMFVFFICKAFYLVMYFIF